MRYTAFDDLTDAEYERAVFRLTDEQRAQVDSVSSRDAKTMYLQNFHQQHGFGDERWLPKLTN